MQPSKTISSNRLFRSLGRAKARHLNKNYSQVIMPELIELAKLAAVGIIAGLFSASLAIRRYRHEKWWEMRAAAYREAIESLSDLHHYFHYNYHNWQGSNTIESDSMPSEKWTQTQEKIRRLSDAGAFLFSEKAEESLRRFRDEQFKWKPENDPDDYYGFYVRQSKRCLDELVAISRRDLKIREFWL